MAFLYLSSVSEAIEGHPHIITGCSLDTFAGKSGGQHPRPHKRGGKAFKSLWQSHSGQLAHKPSIGVCPKTKMGWLIGANRRQKKKKSIL